MSITTRGGMTFTDGVFIEASSGPYLAQVYYNIQDILSTKNNGDTVSSLPNIGLSGTSFNAAAIGTPVTVATVNGYKVLSFNGSQPGFNIPNTLNMSTNGSLFFVGQQTSTRLVAFGGSGSYQYCMFGFGSNNGSVILFRDTNDGGLTYGGLSAVSGLKVMGIVKSGSSATLYDNSTTGISVSPGAGNYVFTTVGYRSVYSQYSVGYLGDLVWFSTAISSGDAQQVILTLKSKYGIA